jgi:MFS family permease
MPAFATDALKTGAGGYGALLSANGIGALLGALTVASVGHRVSRRFLVFGGLWIFSAMLLLLSFVQNFYLALLFLAVGGWGMLLFFSTTNTLLQISASDEMRGRVMGIWALVFGGMMPIGGLEAGSLSHWFGVRWTVAIGAIVCALAAGVTLLIVRRWKPE